MPAPKSGYDGELFVDSPLVQFVELRQFDWRREGDEEDTSAMGVTRTDVKNPKVTGTAVAWNHRYPGATQEASHALMNVNDVVPFEWRPHGTGTGLPVLSGSLKVKTEVMAQSFDAFVQWTFDWELDGADDFVRGTQP